MQDFFENAEPRTVAMMLIGIVFQVAAAEVTYPLWPQVKSLNQRGASHQVLVEAVPNNDSRSS